MVAVLRKDIRRFMMIEHIMPRVWKYRLRWTPTLGVRRRQCTARERLAKYGKVEVSTFNTYCKSKFCPRRFWTLLDKAEVELILFSSINRYLGSERMEFASRRSKDNSLQQSCSHLPKPLKKDDL